MFKKTLMAAALAAATGSALAGEITVTGTAYKVGNEYLASYTGSALQGDLEAAAIGIQYRAGIALGVNNTLKFEFTGGAISADVGLKLQDIDNTTAHADDAAVQTAIDAAVAAIPDSGNQADDLADMKAAAIGVINDTAAATNATAAIAAINAVTVGANYAADVAAVQGVNPVVIGDVNGDIADLVDFGTDDNGDYEWVLFKLTGATTADAVIVFNDTDNDTSANVVTNFTKETIGAGDLSISLPEAKDDTGAELVAPRAGSQTLVTTADQFSVTADLVEDTIDVEQDRQFFVAAANGEDTTGTFTFDVTEDATIDLGIDPAAAAIEFTLDGDFTGVASADLVDANATAAGDDSGAFDADNMLAGDGIDDADITITVDGTTNLATRTVGLTVMVTPNEADTEAFYLLGGASSSSDAFDWGLNGSEINFPYAPIGYSHITTNFELANSGDQEGDILVSAIGRDGSSFSGTLTQKATTGSLVKISQSDVYTALGLTEAASLSITFTTTAPEDDIKITGYSNLESGGRMALLSDAYETADCTATSVVNNDGTITETTDVTVTCD